MKDKNKHKFKVGDKVRVHKPDMNKISFFGKSMIPFDNNIYTIKRIETIPKDWLILEHNHKCIVNDPVFDPEWCELIEKI